MEVITRPQTLVEEIVNIITHGVGFILGILALTYYTTLQGDFWQFLSVVVYGSTLLFLYLSSTLYHTIQKPKLKQVFRKLDHAAIYLFIAGCYTPLMLIKLRETWGWTILGIVWGLALVGVGIKLFCQGKFAERFSLGLYLLMGWLVVLFANPVIEVLPLNALFLLGLGGIAYMMGVIFYVKDKVFLFHSVWHVFVLLGTLFHFYCFAFYILPTPLPVV